MGERVLESGWIEVEANTYHYPDDNIKHQVEKKENCPDGGETLKTICGGNCCYHIRDTFILSVSVTRSATWERYLIPPVAMVRVK